MDTANFRQALLNNAQLNEADKNRMLQLHSELGDRKILILHPEAQIKHLTFLNDARRMAELEQMPVMKNLWLSVPEVLEFLGLVNYFYGVIRYGKPHDLILPYDYVIASLQMMANRITEWMDEETCLVEVDRLEMDKLPFAHCEFFRTAKPNPRNIAHVR